MLTGKSLRGIAIAWDDRGLRTTRGNKFTSMQVRRTLINPLYAGLVTHHEKVVGPRRVAAPSSTRPPITAWSPTCPTRRVRPAVSFEKRHMLSGVATLRQVWPGRLRDVPGRQERGIVYSCRPSSHVARRGALLDEYVEALVLAWFSQPKTRKRLAGLLNGGRDVDVKALQAQRDALQARMDKLARMHIAGDIDDSQLRSGTSEHRAQRDAIDKVLTKASRRSPAAGMLAADDPRAYWAACSPDIRGKIVDEIMTVPCFPTPRADHGSKTAPARRLPSGSDSASTSTSSRRRDDGVHESRAFRAEPRRHRERGEAVTCRWQAPHKIPARYSVREAHWGLTCRGLSTSFGPVVVYWTGHAQPSLNSAWVRPRQDRRSRSNAPLTCELHQTFDVFYARTPITTSAESTLSVSSPAMLIRPRRRATGSS